MSFFSRLLGGRTASAPAEIAEPTFKTKIQDFWAWFAENSEAYLSVMGAPMPEAMVEEMSKRVNLLFPGLAWEFGPPPAGVEGHSLALSGEGVLTKQLLAIHAVGQAPPLPGWTFHDGRQSSGALADGRSELRMGELTFRPLEFWVTPAIDEEHEVVDINVWHPLHEQVPKNTLVSALYLTLDDLFGEFGTGRWIGEINFGAEKLHDSMPIVELPEFVAEEAKRRGWKDYKPGSTWTSYRFKELNAKPRGDTIAGTSLCMGPLKAFWDDAAKVEDPFEGCGADWIFLSFNTAFLPEGDEINGREDIAEAIEKALSDESAGRYLGGAIGRQQTYLDFLIYDGARSLELIRACARALDLPADTSMTYLASGKRGQGGRLLG